MFKPSIIIIGAGASGLMAAKELSPDFEVVVLEAQSHIGGRIQSISKDGNIFEAGAEFVHGNLPVTLGILKEAGIGYVNVEGKMYRKKNGSFNSVEEMTVDWDGLLEKMRTVTHDITVRELLDKYYPGPGNELLRKQVRSYAEGFDVADIEKASVKALYQEWSAEDEDNFRIAAGYSKLTEYLQQTAIRQGAAVLTENLVKEVNWQPGKVTVRCANGKNYTANKLLVTVPVSVLQQPASKASIHFNPAVHFNEKVPGDIGFGAVLKVVLKFKNPFWQRDAGFILSDELFPTWWTQLPDHTAMLTGWMGGPKAAVLSAETDKNILSKAVASLAAIYDKTIAELEKELEEGMIFNWQKNEYAMGAYSYPTVDSEKAKEIISSPLVATIFFAGEALYSGDHPGTVEAALVSGINAAALIKSTISSS